MAEASKRTPLFTESPQGLLVLDRAGHVLDVNPAGCQLFARPRDRLQGVPLVDWVLPGDREASLARLQEARDGEPREWKARIRRGDGLPRVQHFRAVPLWRGEGVEGILVFLRDLTAAPEGRPEVIQLQTLLENLPGQFVLVTDRAGKIRYSSGLGRTHFRDNTAVLGAPYLELLGRERDGEESLHDLLREVGEGRNWSGMQWHRRQDGHSFPAEIFASPHLDPRSGQVLGVLVVGRDLTALHRWRERAETAEPLAQIGALMTRISKEMSKGFSRVGALLEEVGPGGRAGGVGLEGAREEVERLEGFLSGVAEFGDRGTFRREKVSLPELAHEVLEAHRARLEARPVELSVEVPPNFPAVFVDRRYLKRALEILLENALDALEGAAEPRLHIELRNGSEGALFRMTNAGSKVQEDWLPEIFDPFFTTRTGRSGLGLAVARSIVQAHEGRIWGEIPEEGSLTLALELPKDAPERVRSFRPVPLNLARSRTVLVVDDDESIRLALRAFLEKVGYAVREAWSGRSALAQLTAGRLPEIVITDLKMSDGSGYWFLDELGRGFPRLVRRTVILTGDADHEAADDLSKRTGCPLVRKPFELPFLLEVLDQVALKN